MSRSEPTDVYHVGFGMLRVRTSSRAMSMRYSHVIGFGIIRGYIYVYIIAWRPASLAVDFFGLQEPDSPEAAPPSPNYVPGPEEPEQAPLSLDYVPGPEYPPSPVEVPYVPEPEYPEYLAPSDEEVPIEDQPYDDVDSPIALSPGYIADSDPKEDPEDDTSQDEEPVEDEDDDEEEEEHLAPADSSAVPVTDLSRLLRARKTVRLKPPMSPSMEARIAKYAAAPT
ncbi:hypothetical protein Tco_0266452 [Tanacetum coccineum]